VLQRQSWSDVVCKKPFPCGGDPNSGSYDKAYCSTIKAVCTHKDIYKKISAHVPSERLGSFTGRRKSRMPGRFRILICARLLALRGGLWGRTRTLPHQQNLAPSGWRAARAVQE
jgi:hypothetical protein